MKVEIFSRPRCGHCSATKELLTRKGIAFIGRDIAADARYLEELRRRLPRAKVVPQIFIDREHIGGHEDLCHLEAAGELGCGR